MEALNQEREPAELHDLTKASEESLSELSKFVREHSWGEEYPESPLEEIRAAEFRVGAYKANMLVGFGSITRNASPDGRDNEGLWLAHAVVLPQFRQKGVYSQIYTACMSYAKKTSEKLSTCTDNPVMEKFFIDHGWQKIRETKDVAGERCVVFEYR